ncbi:MAG: hypothetical protein CMP91_11015 [Gammaproteobacteria bacterium]|nr:hypothetical protein [Gammaproteobacteria bacterium]MAY02200.1 hypothetical protein [Gammaproteobacteria bacterium]|tara:strand:- start:1688 stop:2350 length:663 start_codon:yes stop_codon:yes gene_type:complete
MEIKELISIYPTLYHMAEFGSWENIKANGLLSTSALLDLYKINGQKRQQIETCHRSESITINCQGLPTAVVRDQKPMSDSALQKVLLDNLTPADWYRILNSKVFFWSSYEKVLKLLNARAYRSKSHDVIAVDTASLIKNYSEKIFLCPYNRGSTIMSPVQRGKDLFKPIQEYDFLYWKKKRGRAQAVTEVCVEGGVDNMLDIVVNVKQMRQQEILATLHS